MVGAQRLDYSAFCMLVSAVLCVLGHWQAGSRTRSLQWVETIFMLVLSCLLKSGSQAHVKKIIL